MSFRLALLVLALPLTTATASSAIARAAASVEPVARAAQEAGSGADEAADPSPEPSPVETMTREAEAMRAHVTTPLARSFLSAVACLPEVERRVVSYHPKTREAYTLAEAAARSAEEQQGFEETGIPPSFYYATRYGTPVAFVRPLEILGGAGVEGAAGLRLVDFGFGSIGQLRTLAALGAQATGVEIDPLLRAIYSEPGDTGAVPRCAAATPGEDGRVRLLYGSFPADAALVQQLGGGYDVFVAKNTLKRGYVHPEREVDPRLLVHLGVDDEAFVRAVHDLLRPGGLALIYNLSPAPAPESEPYEPWADGRSPWPRELYESLGFQVLAFGRNDDASARAMGAALGWGSPDELEADLYGTYTLLRRTEPR